MRIADLGVQPGGVHRQAADLLVEGFDHPQGWPDLESATDEVEGVIRRGFAFAALEDTILATDTPSSSTFRLGYVVTGVMPDANGPGKPDIYMSKPAGSIQTS